MFESTGDYFASGNEIDALTKAMQAGQLGGRDPHGREYIDDKLEMYNNLKQQDLEINEKTLVILEQDIENSRSVQLNMYTTKTKRVQVDGVDVILELSLNNYTTRLGGWGNWHILKCKVGNHDVTSIDRLTLDKLEDDEQTCIKEAATYIVKMRQLNKTSFMKGYK
jgi:hypothetical protein